jgi:hypothetical protein
MASDDTTTAAVRRFVGVAPLTARERAEIDQYDAERREAKRAYHRAYYQANKARHRENTRRRRRGARAPIICVTPLTAAEMAALDRVAGGMNLANACADVIELARRLEEAGSPNVLHSRFIATKFGWNERHADLVLSYLKRWGKISWSTR